MSEQFFVPAPWEPGPDQRWSTWDSVLAGQRGPEPRPDWVVTASAAVDTELGILKTGKEADVFLIERAVPARPGTLLAAKRYREPDKSNFHRSARLHRGPHDPEESRGAGSGERSRPSAGRSRPLMWAGAEFDALCLALQPRRAGALPGAGRRLRGADGVHRRGGDSRAPARADHGRPRPAARLLRAGGRTDAGVREPG